MRRLLAFGCVAVSLAVGCGREQVAVDGGTDPSAGGDPQVLVLELFAGDGEPGARLVWGERVVEGHAFTYCWDQGGVGACADGIPSWPERFLDVPQGTALVVRGEYDEAEVHLAPPTGRDDDPIDYDRSVEVALAGGRGLIGADPGEYALDVFAYYPQGDGSFVFGLRVMDGQAD